MIGRWCSVALALALVASAGCHRPKSARRPIIMVPLPPREEPPHSHAGVAAGGAVTFEADQVVSCEADAPDLVRAYATEESLTLIGLAPGRTTLHLRIAAGDEFLVDIDVTNDPPARRAIAVGEQLLLPLAGPPPTAPSSSAVRTTVSTDGAHLIVVGIAPGVATLGPSAPEVVVIGGTRLL